MDAKARILIPNIHIKEERISDDESKNPGRDTFLRYFNRSAELLLERTAPTIEDGIEKAVNADVKDAHDVYSQMMSLLESGQTAAFTNENKNYAESKSGNEKVIKDILAETIDSVARGLFESNNDMTWSSQINVKDVYDVCSQTDSLLVPDQKAACTDKNQNCAKLISGNEVIKDILTETIDSVAKGLFESNNDILCLSHIFKPKTPIVHKMAPRNRVYRKGAISTELSLLLSKPFAMNWKREVVHRSINNTLKPNLADTYYFSPTGRKFRSLPQLAAYLEATNESELSINSFTFHKARISDHPNETERYAKRKSEPQDGMLNSNKVLPETKRINKHVVPEMDIAVVNEYKQRDSIRSPSLENNNVLDDIVIEEYRCNDAKECTMEATRHTNAEDGGMLRCSSNCAGQMGVIPSLQCNTCLCLFHPQCIGLSKTSYEILQFICKECCKKGSDQTTLGPSKPQTINGSSYSQNAHQPGISSLSTQACWKVSNVPSNADSTLQKIILVKTLDQNYQHPVVNNSERRRHFPGGMTIEKVDNVISRCGPTEPDAASISLIPIVHPRSVVVPHIADKSELQKNWKQVFPSPLTQTVIASGSLIQPSTRNGDQLCNTASSNVVTSSPAQMVHASSQQCKTTSVCPSLNYTDVTSRSLSYLHSNDHAYNKLAGPPNEGLLPSSSSSSVNIHSNSVLCPNNAFGGSHDCMLHILSFLPLPDLMRATQVCRAWRTASEHPMMWKHVSLRNMRITCWETFAEIVYDRRTHHLDMRGMRLYDDKNRTWHEFAAILPQLKGLRRLDIGEVPAAILHTVANTLTQLVALSAESIVASAKDANNAISNCRFFIGRLCQLPNLTVLRIRGVYGLLLPYPSSGLDGLECLKHLKSLSLTSIKYQTAPDLNFLKALPCLSVLELGDCHEWTLESYQGIGHLKQLKNLRLEFEGKHDCGGLKSALQGLSSLVCLDLIMFQIPENLGEILAELPKLSTLRIWPDNSSRAAENNYNVIQGLKCVPLLKNFTWGLIASHLLSNRPGDKFNPQDNIVPFWETSDNGKLKEMQINAGTLMSTLRFTLPSSNVRLLWAPNSSHKATGCIPR